MKTPDASEERPLAWNAILENTPVYSSDGSDLGGIREVLGAEDIFHGIVVRHGITAHELFIPAENVTTITNERIDVDLTADQVRELPPYKPEETFRLGIVGLFRKHLGWVDSEDRSGPGGD